MHKYVLRRLLLVIPVLVLSSLVVFGLMRVMPGDALTALMAESGNVSPRELQKLRNDLGLDRPYHEQYLLWIWQLPVFSANNPPAHARERGRKSLPGAGLRADAGGRSAR